MELPLFRRKAVHRLYEVWASSIKASEEIPQSITEKWQPEEKIGACEIEMKNKTFLASVLSSPCIEQEMNTDVCLWPLSDLPLWDAHEFCSFLFLSYFYMLIFNLCFWTTAVNFVLLMVFWDTYTENLFLWFHGLIFHLYFWKYSLSSQNYFYFMSLCYMHVDSGG